MVDPDLPELKARAEQMRREGASMAEVARAVGRSPSTVYGWAAQGGWRIVELEAEGFAPAKDDRPPAARPACPVAARSEGPDGPEHQKNLENPLTSILSPKGERQNDAAPLSPLEAAKALHQRSAELGAAGQIRAAEAAARLAERILRTEVQLLRAGLSDPGPDPDPEGFNEFEGGYRGELERRFARLRAAKEREREAEANGGMWV